MAYASWQSLERHTLSLLNKLDANDASALEALLVGTGAIAASDMADEAFPPAKVRYALVLAHQAVIALICKTPGHHRRVEYLLNVEIQHGANVPSSLGPRVFSWKDPSDPNNKAKRRTLINREASIIDELRKDTASQLEVKILYYDLRGDLFVCSTDDKIECEYYDSPIPAKHPKDLAALFDVEGDLCKIADEFISPVCNLAAGIVLMTLAGGGVAAQFFAAAKVEFEAQGLAVPEADYQTWQQPQSQP